MLLLNTLKSSADFLGFPGGSHSKMESAYNARDLGSIPGSGRSPGEGNGNPPQYSCLENSMDRGAWQATVHGVAKSWTQLSNSPHTHTHTHTHTASLLFLHIFYQRVDMVHHPHCIVVSTLPVMWETRIPHRGGNTRFGLP